MGSLALWLGLALALLASGCASARPAAPRSAPAETETEIRPPLLQQDVPRTGTMAGGGRAEYRLRAEAGWYVRLTVEQAGIELAVKVLDDSGLQIAAAEGPSGRQLPETLALVAPAAGELCVVVEPHSPDAPPGRYGVELLALRPPRPGDAERVDGEAAFNAAKHWQARGDAAAKEKAFALFEQALADWHAAGEPFREVETLNQIGKLERALGNAREAIRREEQALSLALQTSDGLGEAEARNNLGMSYSDDPKTPVFYEEALRLWRALGESAQESATLLNLGIYLQGRGELDRASRVLDRALKLRQSAGDLAGQAPILTTLGGVYRDRGDLDAALRVIGQALDLTPADEDRSPHLHALQNQGIVLLRLGEFQQALESFKHALELTRVLGEHASEGRTLSYLAATALHLGDASGALDQYSKALAIFRDLKDDPWTGYTLRDIGWVHDIQGEPELALRFYEQAFAIARSAGSGTTLQAAALHGMGRAHIALGRSRQAVTELEQASSRFAASGNVLGEIYALVDQGRACAALPDPERAAKLFAHALELSRQRRTLVAEAVARSAVARLEAERGDLGAAADEIEHALQTIESLRPKVDTQRLRVSYFASRHEYYEFYVDLLMRLEAREPGRGHLAAALAVSERARARGLLDLLAEGHIEHGISPELKLREAEVEEQISRLQIRLLEDLSGRQRGSAIASSLDEELRRAEADREEVETQIRREHPHYAAVRAPAPLAVERIQPLLDEHTALLEYAVGNASSFLFVVTRERLAGFHLPPAAELASLVGEARGALQRPGRALWAHYVQTASRLYAVLVAPAADILRDKPHLIVSPDGPLLLLSFEALLTRRVSSPAADLWDLPYLILDKAVTYIPSASVLAELAESPAKTAAGTTLFVGFANPQYQPLTGAASPVAPLAESGREVREIARLFPLGQSEIHLGAEASEENVKTDLSLRTARYLHFAVHGFVNEQQPELSGLLLAHGAGEDGLLQVYEVFNLDLAADLVVLSACDTALGKNVSGEGLIGVTRALLYAGAASVVVSLWQVGDASTADLMIEFYRHLRQNVDKTEALRLAKLEMIHAGQLSHPYYWAPFVLIGQPR